MGDPAAAALLRLAAPQHGGAFTTLTAIVVCACADGMANSLAYRGGIETVTE
jgi:hypothetical protein